MIISRMGLAARERGKEGKEREGEGEPIIRSMLFELQIYIDWFMQNIHLILLVVHTRALELMKTKYFTENSQYRFST